MTGSVKLSFAFSFLELNTDGECTNTLLVDFIWRLKKKKKIIPFSQDEETAGRKVFIRKLVNYYNFKWDLKFN